jgi:hypothetical protein
MAEKLLTKFHRLNLLYAKLRAEETYFNQIKSDEKLAPKSLNEMATLRSDIRDLELKIENITQNCNECGG